MSASTCVQPVIIDPRGPSGFSQAHDRPGITRRTSRSAELWSRPWSCLASPCSPALHRQRRSVLWIQIETRAIERDTTLEPSTHAVSSSWWPQRGPSTPWLISRSLPLLPPTRTPATTVRLSTATAVNKLPSPPGRRSGRMTRPKTRTRNRRRRDKHVSSPTISSQCHECCADQLRIMRW